ncbi:MAG TPA: transcriptional repressor [Acidimicrobiales bacterium]|nr:transcriptional repressor [Acidimicrobiales bacterium]
MTPQRRAVAVVLTGDQVHLTAEEVHGRAQEVLPEISLATVYNTLNELVAMGEVLEVAAGAGPKRYDPNVETAHHHLVCTSCGSLRDVHPSGAARVTLPDVERHGFALTGVDFIFRGVCPDCRGAA